MIRAILFSLAMVGLSACAGTDRDTPTDVIGDETTKEAGSDDEKTTTNSEYQYKPVRFNLSSPDAEPSEVEKQACAKVGGKVQRAGLRGSYHCVQTYPDAGKICSDSSECVGQCRTVSSRAMGKPGTGTCQNIDVPFGCFALVNNGMVDGAMLCVD